MSIASTAIAEAPVGAAATAQPVTSKVPPRRQVQALRDTRLSPEPR